MIILKLENERKVFRKIIEAIIKTKFKLIKLKYLRKKYAYAFIKS